MSQPIETPEQKQDRILTEDRFLAYTRGWRDGACRKGINQGASEHPVLGVDYDAGWSDGRMAQKAAHKTAAERLGYTQRCVRMMAE